MSLLEILQANKDIKWSEEYTHEDGGPADTHGLVLVKIDEEAVRLTQSRELVYSQTAGVIGASLWFGYPTLRKIGVKFTSSDYLNPADANQINGLNELSREFVTLTCQCQTSLKVDELGEIFSNHLRLILGENTDPKTLKNAGIIQELLTELKDEHLPKNIGEIAAKLKSMGIAEVEEWDRHIVYFPDYLQQLFSSTA